MAAAKTALRAWEIDNSIRIVDPTRDAIYNYDAEAQKAIAAARPWSRDPEYFKSVRISAVALTKMTMHARSGGDLEVMGLMQGYVLDGAFIVTDAFRLPVEGTETRVNAQNEANEYLVEYLALCRSQGRQENVVGWYHSHPGYGCWLSGIDVDTEEMQQKYQDPFLAVVIDPHRTVSAGKVEIGAFRTFPESAGVGTDGGGGKTAAPALGSEEARTVPLAKAAEFGAHANRYYSLGVSHFKSTLDAQLLERLWHKYWVQTLSQNAVVTNRDYSSKQLLDLGSKIKEATATLAHCHATQGLWGGGDTSAAKKVDRAVAKVAEECHTLAAKERSGLEGERLKAQLFNSLASPHEQEAAVDAIFPIARTHAANEKGA